MKKQGLFGCRRTVGLALALVMAVVMATGCCLVVPQARVDDAVPGDVAAAAAIPILVTLAAEEGAAFAVVRRRVLERLRLTMSADAFAAVRTYETLPIVALAATPETIALLLTLTDVRSIEADRSYQSL